MEMIPKPPPLREVPAGNDPWAGFAVHIERMNIHNAGVARVAVDALRQILVDPALASYIAELAIEDIEAAGYERPPAPIMDYTSEARHVFDL